MLEVEVAWLKIRLQFVAKPKLIKNIKTGLSVKLKMKGDPILSHSMTTQVISYYKITLIPF